MFKKLAYDQFYCEHIYVFSTLALREFLKNFELEIFDIEIQKRMVALIDIILKKYQ